MDANADGHLATARVQRLSLAPAVRHAAEPSGRPEQQVIDLRPELVGDAVGLARLTNPVPARAIRFWPGQIDFDLLQCGGGDPYGVMVLDGLLFGELDAGRARAGWLVGTHDLIRPSAMGELVLTERVRWRALKPTRIVLLDREFGLRSGGIPLVSRVLVRRATRTSNWLLAESLVMSSPAVEERLLLLFALLGERWGTVTTEGVILSLPLTHAMLAALCGARRPSVTIALRSLERAEFLTCASKGRWLLRRRQSDERRSRPAGLTQFERSLGLDWSCQ